MPPPGRVKGEGHSWDGEGKTTCCYPECPAAESWSAGSQAAGSKQGSSLVFLLVPDLNPDLGHFIPQL